MIDAQPSPSETDPPRKAILICPDCGHENDVDGDWVVSHDHGRLNYDCPVCGTTITERYQSPRLLSH
ncbi:MAG: hypothetical protein ACOCPT_04455 [Halanaeroarchaeum sp.]